MEGGTIKATTILIFRGWITDELTGASWFIEKWSDGQVHVIKEWTPQENSKT